MGALHTIVDVVGLGLSLYGTYLMATGYLAVSFLTFLRELSRVVMCTTTFRRGRAKETLLALAQTGEVNVENRVKIIEGLLWMFVGFLLSLVSLLWK